MISTGISGLDWLLGGGITGGTVTDIFGPSGTGKTQLAIQICVNSLIKGHVLYQDTSGGFRPERALDIIKANGKDSSLLDNMMVARITNTQEQIKYLDKIIEIKPNLVAIDNITDLFSYEYSKESNSLERHIKFMEYMHNLTLLAVQSKIPIVVTNTVRRSNESEGESMGKSISMFTHKKIKLAKYDQKYVAQVFPVFGDKKQIYYKITSDGIVESS